MRLPLLLASLAALLIVLSAALMWFSQSGRAGMARQHRLALELADTVDQLKTVVSSNTDWAQSDQLARLVASGDVQIDRLTQVQSDANGIRGLFDLSSGSGGREVKADWLLLREGLLTFNKAAADQPPSGASDDVVELTDVTPSEAVDDASNAVVPSAQLVALAADFEQVRALVAEGTRSQSLIDLVNSASLVWAQVDGIQGIEQQNLITQQQEYADQLLLLSRVGTDNSLYGYYTSNQVLDYVQRIQSIELPQAVEPAAVEAPPVAQTSLPDTSEAKSPAANAGFVSEAIAQLQQSLNSFIQTTSAINVRTAADWIAMTGFGLALLALLALMSRLWRTAALLRDATAPDTSHSRGALSVRDADQLIDDITALAHGDLRHAVDVPDNTHGKAIADSVNQSAAIMTNLVDMTRGVADRLGALVQQHQQLGSVLAEHDIRRQSETAELSDSVSGRSVQLDRQLSLLSESAELARAVNKQSESAGEGVNQVSASVATLSAQIEVSTGRLRRLLQTAGKVTGTTGQLKQVAEQTRLQALNVSLKLSAAGATESLLEDSFTGEYNEPGYIESTVGLFDEIHQLTGTLVQMTNDTDALITTLQDEIEETAQTLSQSAQEIAGSARHTYTQSSNARDLTAVCDQLQSNLTKALSSVEMQKSELSHSAERLVQLDKTGNRYSELTMSLTQDVTELRMMAAKLEESVGGFKLRGETPLE